MSQTLHALLTLIGFVTTIITVQIALVLLYIKGEEKHMEKYENSYSYKKTMKQDLFVAKLIVYLIASAIFAVICWLVLSW
jgi:hypothetical protein